MRRLALLILGVLILIAGALGVICFTDFLPFRAQWAAKGLGSADPDVRIAAARILVEIDPGMATEQFLLQAQRDLLAGKVLGGDSEVNEFMFLPVQVIPDLSRRLDEEDPLLAQAAAWGISVLAYCHPDEDFEVALPALDRALVSEYPALRSSAALALMALGPRALDAVPALVKALEGGLPEAAMALGAIGRSPELAIPALVHALSHEVSNVRLEAAWALAQFQNEKTRVIPPLIGVLADPEPFVAWHALNCIEYLECTDRAAVLQVIQLMRQDDLALRKHAAEWLARAASTDPERTDALAWALKDPELVETVLGALDASTGIPPELVPVLAGIIEDTTSDLRADACAVLGRMGPAAREAVLSLRRVLDGDPDADLADCVRAALAEIEGPSKEEEGR